MKKCLYISIFAISQMLTCWHCEACDKDDIPALSLEKFQTDEENLGQDLTSQDIVQADDEIFVLDQFFGDEEDASSDEEGDPYLDNDCARQLEYQKELQSHKNISKKNAEELSLLSEHGFVVTAKNLDNLQDIADGEESGAIPLSVDLFTTPGNFAAALEYGLTAAVHGGVDRALIGEDLEKFLDQVKYLRATTKVFQINEILPALTGFCEVMSSKVSKKDDFFHFISSMAIIAKIIEARNQAILVVKAAEEMVLNEMLNEETTISGKISASTTINGVNVGGGAEIGGEIGVSKKIGKDREFDDAPFEVAKKTTGKLTVGLNSGIVKAVARVITERGKSDILFSALSYLLDPKLGKGLFVDKSIKSAFGELKNLQDLEKKGIAAVGSVFKFLKDARSLPQNIHAVFPVFTKAVSTRHSKSSSVGLEAEVALFDKINVKVQVERKKKDTARQLGLMSLVDKHFVPATKKYDADAIKKIIGKKYDRTELFKDQSASESFSMILNDLNQYLNALQTLGLIQSGQKIDRISRKKARTDKHSIEHRWSPKRRLRSEGREGVLRAMFCTMVKLVAARGTPKNDKEKRLDLEQRTEIYNNLCELCNYQELSKNKHNTGGTYEEHAEAKLTALAFAVTFTIPGLGNLAANVKIFLDKEKKIQKIHLWFDAPLACISLVAESLIHKLTDIGDQIDSVSEDSGRSLGSKIKLFCLDAIQQDNVSRFIKTVLAKKLALGEPLSVGSLTAKTNLTSASSVRIELDRVPNEIDLEHMRPLPGQTKLIEKNASCFVKYVDVQIKSSIALDSVVGGGRTKIETTTCLGDKSFAAWKDFYHQATLSEADMRTLTGDSESTVANNSLWKHYLSQHAKALQRLLKNITNPNSNAAFEFQYMYNEMLNRDENSIEQDKVTQTVKALLDACTKLRDVESDNTSDLNAAYNALQESFASISEKYQKKSPALKEFMDASQNLLVCIEEYRYRSESSEEKAQALAAICNNICTTYNKLKEDKSICKKSRFKEFLKRSDTWVETVNKYHAAVKKDFNKALSYVPPTSKVEQAKKDAHEAFYNFMTQYDRLVITEKEKEDFTSTAEKQSLFQRASSRLKGKTTK